MKWRIFFLNIAKLSEMRKAGSSLFHSEIVERKSFLKNYFLYWKRECCAHFLKYEMSAWQELNRTGTEDAHF